jgi:RNA recognition motif-containing protein
MQSTIVTLEGKGSNPKTTLYVGGLDETVNKDTVHAAFIPFGDILDISVPLDHATGKHRGFAFVQFEEGADAEAALDNLNNAGMTPVVPWGALLEFALNFLFCREKAMYPIQYLAINE